MEHPLALNFLHDERWAIRPAVFEQMLEIVENGGNKELAAELRNQRKEKAAARSAALFDLSVPGFEGQMYAGGVAVIPFVGPHFPRANFFTEVSGAVSLKDFNEQFRTALNDPKVKSIVIDFDSPGGSVTGTGEASQLVASARGVKPVTAFASGLLCSGAYWIASAAIRIVMDPSAEAGSVGVQASFVDNSEAAKKVGVNRITIVASQSPKKNLPPTTPEGRAEIQRIVDDLAQVMLDQIAANRGIDPAQAQSKLGEGSVFVAAQAVKVGLADATSTFAELIRSESEKIKGKGHFMDKTNVEEGKADFKAKHPAIYEAIHQEGFAAGKAAENARLASLDQVKKAGYEDFIAAQKKDPAMTAEKLALALNQEEQKRAANKSKALEDDAKGVRAAAETHVVTDDEGQEKGKKAKTARLVDLAAKSANSINPAQAGKGGK